VSSPAAPDVSLQETGELSPVVPDELLRALLDASSQVFPDDRSLPEIPDAQSSPEIPDELPAPLAAPPQAQTLAVPGSCRQSDAVMPPSPDGPCLRSPSSAGSALPAAQRQSATATVRAVVRAVPPSPAVMDDSSTRRGRR
jgi:hypothetical protein